MTIAVDLGRKATKQTNKQTNSVKVEIFLSPPLKVGPHGVIAWHLSVSQNRIRSLICLPLQISFNNVHSARTITFAFMLLSYFPLNFITKLCLLCYLKTVQDIFIMNIDQH